MTIGNSLWIGVSGMISHGEAMSTVGDNIANVSTIGFKRERASFNDVLGGEYNNTRVGGGVYLGANQTMWQQGTLTQTGNPMDVGINGNGMFVVAGNHMGQNQQYYTRDGRFQLDAHGTMVDQHGMSVQGYMVTNGQKSGLGNLDLGGRQSPAQMTATAKMTLNLSSADTTPTGAWDPANPDTTSNYHTSITVHDSLGAEHQVQMYYRNNGAGQWDVHAMVDGGEAGGTAGTPIEIGTGSLQFGTNGELVSQSGTMSATFTNASAQTIAMNFGDDTATGGTGRSGTQMSANADATASVDIDGHGAGSLTDIKINPNGSIEGIFDNGDTFEIAKLAIAQFTNDGGLQRQGDSLYRATNESGQAVIDEAGVGGRGATMSGTLEQSNVDLSTELVTLIAYQRAFQANSKTVTTADEMMQEVTNLKR